MKERNFKMTLTYSRHIVLDGNHNFRDLGGYQAAGGRKIRWRRLFRSDGLHGLTAAGVTALQAIQPRMVFDLRSVYELETDGLGTLFDDEYPVHRHTPFFPNQVAMPTDHREPGADIADLYLRMLDTARPAICDIFTALADNDTYPAIYHCSAGKDRTGVLTALILRGLDVDDETIIADYALSSQYITPHLEARLASGKFGERYRNIMPAMLRAEPETMRRVLQAIDAEFGPSSEAVLACGVTASQIDRLREHLLED